MRGGRMIGALFVAAGLVAGAVAADAGAMVGGGTGEATRSGGPPSGVAGVARSTLSGIAGVARPTLWGGPPSVVAGVARSTLSGVAEAARPTLWGVAGVARPTLSHGSLSGVAKGEPTLSFRLAAGAGGPALTRFTVEVPPGLRFRGGRISEAFSMRGGEASLKARPGRLRVILRSPARSLSVSIGPPGLATTSELAREAREHSLDELAIGVEAKDTAGRTTKLFVYRYYDVRPHPSGA